jgi:hypothetical protein
MTSDDLPFAIRSAQRNTDLSVEHDEHIDLPLAMSKQRLVRREDLLSTVRTEAFDHLLGKERKGEFRPKVRNVPCTVVAVSFFRHERLPLLSAIVRHSKATVYLTLAQRLLERHLQRQGSRR